MTVRFAVESDVVVSIVSANVAATIFGEHRTRNRHDLWFEADFEFFFYKVQAEDRREGTQLSKLI